METKHCMHCSSELKYIAAGVSKTTGKPYTAFYACPNKCKFPLPAFSQPNPKFQTQQVVQKSQQAVSEKKWDDINRGKCKYGFLLEAYKKGVSLSVAELEAEQWASAAMRWVGINANNVNTPVINVDEEQFPLDNIQF